jgi:xanthine dehydrogenase small subunit
LIDRIGGEQVRNMGTIGGNIANGSPIGDTPPPLIALGATVAALPCKGPHDAARGLFHRIRQAGPQPGEFVESIFVPYPAEGIHFAVYKITKRRDEDITAVCGAFHLTLDRRQGQTSASPSAAWPARRSGRRMSRRADRQAWSEVTNVEAPGCVEDYQPLTDWRATAEYRSLTAKNLLHGSTWKPGDAAELAGSRRWHDG